MKSARYRIFCLATATALAAALVACGGSGASSTGTAPTLALSATSGTGQSAIIGSPFQSSLAVTVTSNGSPASGVSVTFVAPSTGASGNFAGGTSTEVDATNSSGVATSSAFTANSSVGSYTVTASAAGAGSSASFSLSNSATPAASINVTSGFGQMAATGATFSSPLVATVTDSHGNPVGNLPVTFTAPSSGASGLFADKAASETDMTDASGVVTSSALTANATAGSFSVAASVTGVSTNAIFLLKNLTPVVLNGNYVFQLKGLASDASCGAPTFYMAAGVLQVSNNTITGGEQDFEQFADCNDGLPAINVYDQDLINPSGSSITGPDAAGTYTITVQTCEGIAPKNCDNTDPNLGVNGVETFQLSMVSNQNQGWLMESDASAAGSGDFNLQNSAAAQTPPSGGYAFLATQPGVISLGGVIDVDSPGNISGNGSVFDADYQGNSSVLLNQSFLPSTVTGPDAYGRVYFSLVPQDASGFPGCPSGQACLNWAGYIVDSSRTILIQSQPVFSSAYLDAVTGGEARSQGANTGNFSFSNLAGQTYVLSLQGYDTLNYAQVAGDLTFSSSPTGATGLLNYNDGNLFGSLTSNPTYALPYASASPLTVNATGRVSVLGLGTTDPNCQTPCPNAFDFELYLDGNGNALAINIDSYSFGGTGTLQSGSGLSTGNFTGSYAISMTGLNGANGFSAVGSVSANGTGDTLFPGTVDLNWINQPFASNQSLSGFYSASSNPGVLSPGAIDGIQLGGGGGGCEGNGACNFNVFLIDSSGDGILIETDASQETLGTLRQQ